jgi:putative membrane protein
MYQIFVALHLIFIVTWFAGLFYIVRLFVYQAESISKSKEAQEILIPQYKLMSKRLWYGITWPSFVLTLILGTTILCLNPSLLHTYFMKIKLGFVIGLIIYQLLCHRYFLQLQRDQSKKSSNFFRVWNEIATLFLVAIIFLIVLKSHVNWIYAVIGFLLFGIGLMLAIKIYKKIRQ